MAEAKRWSLRQIAMVAGLKERTLQSWIKDGRDPPHADCARICSATGVSLAWLTLGQGPMFAPVLHDGSRSYDGSWTHDGARVLPAAPELEDVPGGQVIDIDPVYMRLYADAARLEDAHLGDDVRKLLRIYRAVDERTRGRVSGFLDGLDPGEKKAGLAGVDGKARLAGVGGARPPTPSDE